MALRFDDRVAIVTGAGNGLGRAYALLLASRGAAVVVNDLGGSLRGDDASSSARPADTVVHDIVAAGGRAVANYDSVEHGHRIVDQALKAFGRIDILICNAGILRDKSFVKMSEQDWRLVEQVHVLGTYAVCRAAWPHLREKSYGRIVCVSSAAGIYGNAGQANYSAAKLAIVGLANTLAKEGQSRNILVNTIAPLAGSRMTETIMPPALTAALRPEYVAGLVAFLAHETCHSSGSLVECGAGWVAALRRQRAKGYASLDPFSPESLAANLHRAHDFSEPSYPSTPADSTTSIMAVLQSKL